MSKTIVLDSGPIINLAINNLLFILEPLREKLNGEFLITKRVKEELIDKPLSGKKFKFEALRVLEQINNGTLKVIEGDSITRTAKEIMHLANNCFKAKGSYIKIVHDGEIESIATILEFGAKAFVIDERTTRQLIEEPNQIQERLEKKLHTKVDVNPENLNRLHTILKDIKVIRSVELAIIAYELKLLDNYLPKDKKTPNKLLLDSLLWALKLNGCSITEKEINRIIKTETRK